LCVVVSLFGERCSFALRCGAFVAVPLRVVRCVLYALCDCVSHLLVVTLLLRCVCCCRVVTLLILPLLLFISVVVTIVVIVIRIHLLRYCCYLHCVVLMYRVVAIVALC